MNIAELEKRAKDELKSNMEDLEVAPEDILAMIELLREMAGALYGMSYWSQPRKADEPELCGFECKQGDPQFKKAEAALAKYKEMTK